MAELRTDYPVDRDTLLYVTREDGSSKGWRVDLLVEKLSSKVEEKLLLCSSCSGLLRDACLCNGALRCQVCIPEGVAWQPVEMNREIVNEKMIYCPLKRRGCDWCGTVGTAVHHLEDCVYLPETCPLGCVSLEGEVVKMERRHIAGHIRDSCPLRKVECEFCEGEVKATEMNLHLEECDEFPLPCPNRCGGEGEEGLREVKRKDIPAHLDEHCPLQKVQCTYWEHGCREEMERRHTDTHEREFLHVHFKLSMTKMEQKQNESTQLLRQELDIANEKIAIQGKDLTTATNRIAVLEKQISDKDVRIASLTETLFTYTQLPTGRLEWNVKEVKQNIRDKERTFSDPFYVGLYTCNSTIDWDYDNTGNVGVFVNILRGDFDAKLHWPIRYKFTFILTNQINSKDNLVKSYEITKEDLEQEPGCFKRPTGHRNLRCFGFPSFISNADILGRKYCKQDSITLHISVELLPPL